MTLYTVCIFQAEAIAYPEPGVAYDPSKLDTWSQHRGFQNPLEVGPGFIIEAHYIEQL
jgi:hypothetical protein